MFTTWGKVEDKNEAGNTFGEKVKIHEHEVEHVFSMIINMPVVPQGSLSCHRRCSLIAKFVPEYKMRRSKFQMRQ